MTCVGCPVSTAGILDGAQQFDGLDDEVNVPDNDTFDWGAADEFSIEFWMNSTSTCSGNEVIVGRDDASSDLHWWIGCAASGNEALFVLIDKNKGNGGTGAWPSSGTDITDGSWHHIVAVKDTTHIRVYVDGAEKDAEAKSYVAGFDGVAPVNLGYLNLSDHYRYEGKLDEVAIYDKALTLTEIQDHFNSGSGQTYCDAAEPAITTSAIIEVSVDCPYIYDVDATGIPAPTYTLTTYPTGMTINGSTGVISWTPDTAGEFDVTVVASNGVGDDDTQNFTIMVMPCPCDMISYWKLDETGSPTLFEDFYGNHDGICSPHGCPSPTTGKVIGAQAFTGGSSGVGIDVPPDTVFDWAAGDSFSIEFWMKRSGSITENDVIIGRDEEGPGASSLHWWAGVTKITGVPSGNLVARNGDGAAFTGSIDVNDGFWHHLVFVRNATTGKNLTYVDGNLDGTVDKPSYSDGFGSATAPINIGWLSLHTKYSYDGAVDEIALYNRALTLTEIQQHHTDGLAGHGYCEALPSPPTIVSTEVTTAVVGESYTYDVDAIGNPTPIYDLTIAPAGMTIDEDTGEISWTPVAAGCFDVTVVATNDEGMDDQSFTIEVKACPGDMISYWKLDETSGTSFYDCYNGNDGSCTGASCPDFVGGFIGGALDFNGTSDYFTVPDDSSLDWGNTDSFTIELWANVDNCTGTNKVMIGRDDRPKPGVHWWMGCSTSDQKAQFTLYDNTDHGTSVTSTTSIDSGGWHHIVAIRDASLNELRIYVDGDWEATQPADIYVTGFSADTTLGIGYMAYEGTPAYYYDGLLDEIALYSRVLTDTEIEQHYTDGLAGLGYCGYQGDFDRDDDVDVDDLAVIAEDFGRTDCVEDCEGDFDGDDDVDGSDLSVFATEFGHQCPSGPM